MKKVSYLHVAYLRVHYYNQLFKLMYSISFWWLIFVLLLHCYCSVWVDTKMHMYAEGKIFRSSSSLWVVGIVHTYGHNSTVHTYNQTRLKCDEALMKLQLSRLAFNRLLVMSRSINPLNLESRMPVRMRIGWLNVRRDQESFLLLSTKLPMSSKRKSRPVFWGYLDSFPFARVTLYIARSSIVLVSLFAEMDSCSQQCVPWPLKSQNIPVVDIVWTMWARGRASRIIF